MPFYNPGWCKITSAKKTTSNQTQSKIHYFKRDGVAHCSKWTRETSETEFVGHTQEQCMSNLSLSPHDFCLACFKAQNRQDDRLAGVGPRLGRPMQEEVKEPRRVRGKARTN